MLARYAALEDCHFRQFRNSKKNAKFPLWKFSEKYLKDDFNHLTVN